LIVAGGALAWSALRPYAAWASRAGAALPPLQVWTVPDEAPADDLDRARAMIGAAVLAPSHWNAQPWRFEVDGATVRLLADARRALPVTDPDQRAMRLSLGAALENLLVACRAWGLRPAVTYHPPDDPGGAIAEVAWSAGGASRDRALYAAIPERRTNRHAYDGRGLYAENRAALTAQIGADLRLHWIDDRPALHSIADLAFEAVRDQILDHRAETECRAWMRLGDDESLRHGDGISIDAFELGGPAKWFASRYFDPDSWLLGEGAGSMAKHVRDGVRSAGALALLTALPRRPDLWVPAGQAYERMALTATGLGIAMQPIDTPLERSAPRAELVRRFGAEGEEPLLFMRLGHARRPDPSPRRSIALVASLRKA
ncbi:MAG: nitroreductase family protein, partial [Candidatus Eisenbacteria bacterium]|nr:nitroreductase family protein [Candidatus Eisenbacteria bacterium]